MLRSVWQWLCVGLCSLLLGQAEAPTPVEPPERSRPYAVLRGQNLVVTVIMIIDISRAFPMYCVVLGTLYI
ncbi:hypothetical protein FD754_009896 [Muntiacus muntjak]|uniref:Uncharacterized protein n=1 Tax=Muntiacus muntjak TaxID=9888 RepID=A0A5N3WV81_MUNMU|nr:hypothetical protein FD754_009896 [Muntiacus muntjak]